MRDERRDDPVADDHVVRLDLRRAQLLGDHELADGVGGLAPRSREVRCGVALFREVRLLRGAFEFESGSEFSANVGADRLGLGRQFDAEHATGPGNGQRRDASTPGSRGAQQNPQGLRAPQVQVRVMLPRVTDSAEHLDAVAGDRETGFEGRGSGDCCCERSLFGADAIGGGQRTRCVPSTDTGLLGKSEHAGGLVLDSLELADHATELLTHLRVVGRGRDCPVGQA